MDDYPAWEALLDEYGAVEFPVSRAVVLRALVGALVFVALGVGIIFIGSIAAVTAGTLAILFFGVIGIPVFLRRVLTGEPKLEVRRDGITFGRRQVGWDEVTAVNRDSTGRRESRNVVLMLTPEAGERVKRQLNPALRLLDPFARRLQGGPSLSILNVNGFHRMQCQDGCPTCGFGAPQPPIEAATLSLRATCPCTRVIGLGETITQTATERR